MGAAALFFTRGGPREASMVGWMFWGERFGVRELLMLLVVVEG
jgi:hypothetical protein